MSPGLARIDSDIGGGVSLVTDFSVDDAGRNDKVTWKFYDVLKSSFLK